MEKIYLETLSELEIYNKKLLVASENIVDFLRGQREDQALNLFISAIDGFNWVLEVIGHTKSILEEYDFNSEIQNINTIFKEMMDTLQNQDYVLLGDLMEYEILPFLNHLESTLDKMRIKGALNPQ